MQVNPHIVSTRVRLKVLTLLKLFVAGAVACSAVPAYAVLMTDCPNFRILVNQGMNDFAAIRQSVKPRQIGTRIYYKLEKPAVLFSECEVTVETTDRKQVSLSCNAFSGPEAKEGEKATGHMERQFLLLAKVFATGVSACLSLSPREGKPFESWPKDSLSQIWTWTLPPSRGSIIEVQLSTDRPNIGSEIDQYRNYKAYLHVHRYDHDPFTDKELEEFFGK